MRDTESIITIVMIYEVTTVWEAFPKEIVSLSKSY